MFINHDSHINTSFNDLNRIHYPTRFRKHPNNVTWAYVKAFSLIR